MRLTIRHDTLYAYDAPIRYSIQQMRLTPLASGAQFVLGWNLDAPGKLEMSQDTYGNTMHTLVLTRPVSAIRLSVSGEIETQALADGRLMEGAGRIPLEHFTCSTRLTEPDPAIVELAERAGALDSPAALLALAEQIIVRVAYRAGITEVSSTAREALRLGHGVCQDHAHLMLACCRLRGLPARYVSGYFDPGEVSDAASHAWVDVWLPAFGWVTIDVTHACFASGRYCRIAVGRDYEAAAPVRGTRVGGGKEHMTVKVEVDAKGQQQ